MPIHYATSRSGPASPACSIEPSFCTLTFFCISRYRWSKSGLDQSQVMSSLDICKNNVESEKSILDYECERVASICKILTQLWDIIEVLHYFRNLNYFNYPEHQPKFFFNSINYLLHKTLTLFYKKKLSSTNSFRCFKNKIVLVKSYQPPSSRNLIVCINLLP